MTHIHQLYRYRAIDAGTGRRLTGELAGASPQAVRAQLRKGGMQVEEVHRADDGALRWLGPFADTWRRLRDGQARRRRRLARADLCDAIASLIQAGMPLEAALGALARSHARIPAERRLMMRLQDQVRSGAGFAEACAAHPGWFDRFDLAIIEAGQRAGDLAGMLTTLSVHHHRAGAVSQRLFVALAYPALLTVVGVVVVEFMSLTTLPQLVEMIRQAHRQPPALTEALISVGQGLARWWPLLLVFLILLVLAARNLTARIPVTGRFGGWWHGNMLARMRGRVRVAMVASALARLRRAGLTLVDGLEVVADTAADRALRQVLRQAAEAIRRGEDLSQVVTRSRLFDPEFAQHLQLGERSGELTDMLERIAERYQRAADRSAERLAAFLGPAAILLLAVLIGLVVMASVLPLLQLGEMV